MKFKDNFKTTMKREVEVEMEFNLYEALNRGFSMKCHNESGEELPLKGVGDQISDVHGNEYIISKVLNGFPVELQPVDYGSS